MKFKDEFSLASADKAALYDHSSEFKARPLNRKIFEIIE
jgi:hypothetical protein